MDIFENLAQQVRFAFAYEPYRDSRALVMVRHALHEAGVKGEIGLQDLLPERLGELRDEATTTLRAVHGLLRVESAALTATFSRDWDERRAAVTKLVPMFAKRLDNIVYNPALVEKLVLRHYTPERELGLHWDLTPLSEEFRVNRSTSERAAREIARVARGLETEALRALREALGLPDSLPTARVQPTAEVAHA